MQRPARSSVQLVGCDFFTKSQDLKFKFLRPVDDIQKDNESTHMPTQHCFFAVFAMKDTSLAENEYIHRYLHVMHVMHVIM